MKRKVIKQGHNTLTITLPSKWVEKNTIVPGEEVEVVIYVVFGTFSCGT